MLDEWRLAFKGNRLRIRKCKKEFIEYEFGERVDGTRRVMTKW